MLPPPASMRREEHNKIKENCSGTKYVIPKKKSRNIHNEITVSTERVDGERLGQKIGVLKSGRHMYHLELAVGNTLTQEVVADVDVFRVRGGCRISGQMHSSYVVLVNESAHHRTKGKKELPQKTQEDALLESQSHRNIL